MKRFLVLLLCLVISMSTFAVLTSAEESIENEREYKPLDLVIVMDNSGSMKDSDKERTAPDAIKMLVNMMPAGDSRVGVVGFNTEATYITTDSKGNGALLNLNDLNDAATIKKNVSKAIYDGGTGIGNAMFAATELLGENKNPDRCQAIILFTDGVNDLPNALLASKCEDNESSSVLWAKKNNCPIYCVGYNYRKPDGTNSMGQNGEGLKKLTNIANSTNGTFREINDIKEIEQLLIEFLADVCDLNYKTVATIPGDGDVHECKIPVSPSVVEANIRIAGGDKGSIEKAKIHLYDPDGNKIELRNSGNVRFDTDATAASIKVIMPKTGTWLLVVDGIIGDDVHVGLLEHFKMNLTSMLTFPEGNPKGVAYSHDKIGIKTWLTYDGEKITNEAIYDAVKSAKAICVPRVNPENKKEVTLKREGMAFVGNFIIPEDCFYDITIRLDWDTVYREDTTLEVRSNNKPLELVSDIPEVKVNKGKTFIIENIYQYVSDDEKDKIEASVTSLSSADVATVNIQGDDAVITGNKWSSTLVTIEYTDAQGNTVDSTFKVKVNDPGAIALIITSIFLIAVAVMLILYISFEKSKKIKGSLYLTQIAVADTDPESDIMQSLEFYDNCPVISLNRYQRVKSLHRISGFMSEIKKIFDNNEIGTDEYVVYDYIATNKNGKKLQIGSDKSKVIGSILGNSFTVRNSRKSKYLTINRVDSGKIVIANGDSLDISFQEKDPTTKRIVREIELKFIFRSSVRVRSNSKSRKK